MFFLDENDKNEESYQILNSIEKSENLEELK